MALDADTSTAPAGAPTAVAPASERPSTLARASPRDDAPAAAASGAQAAVRTVISPRQESHAPPVVPYGFAIENGQLTAVRATAVATNTPIAPVTVMLPAGVRPEDAVVSPTGMVALTRAGTSPVGAAPPLSQPLSVTHSP